MGLSTLRKCCSFGGNLRQCDLISATGGVPHPSRSLRKGGNHSLLVPPQLEENFVKLTDSEKFSSDVNSARRNIGPIASSVIGAQRPANAKTPQKEDLLRLRSGQALKSRSSQSARAGTLAPTSTTAHEREARAYIDNRARAGTLAPTSTTVHGRGRSRLHRQRCTSGDARAYIDNRPRAGAPAPHATWARKRRE